MLAKRIRLILCWALVALGGTVIVGWLAQVEPLKSVVSGLSTMKFNTALGFVLLGIGLVAMGWGPAGRRAAAACGAALVAIGVATMAEYLVPVDLGIDELIVRDTGVLTGSGYPGRMSPLTATVWIALGAALAILATRPRGRSIALAHMLSVYAGFIAFLSGASYAFGASSFWGFGFYAFIAVHTAAGLSLAAAALLLTRAPDGWMRGLDDAPRARRLLVQLLPVALLLPAVLGLLLLLGSGLGLYNAGFAFALFAPLIALAWAAVVLWVAQSARRGELAQRASEERFRRIFEQSNDFILTSDFDQHITSANPAACEALGYSEAEILGRSFVEFLDPDQVEMVRGMLTTKLSQGGATRHTLRVNRRGGEPLIWEISSQLTRDAQGNPRGVHAIGRDVTDQRRAEAHQRLLVDELNHRVKNTLAIVQGIARQTFRRGVSGPNQLDAFEGRLQALGAAHALLTERSWSAADLHEVIQGALKPHLDTMDQVTLDGPAVCFDPKAAVTITIALHELATNATKYGALSAERGRVTIRWSVAEDGGFTLEWEESGGPPCVAPTRKGFGSRMLERALAAELDGKGAIEFRPEGLCYTLTAKLPGVREAT